ncbi:MAG TPA: nitroreductase/quinone reductase family protein [Actinomycetota bacterium]|nr:nitroreductase/quinone reductase family protein [Actinomycetota bacterium]
MTDGDLARLPFCYLSTIGRSSGDPHRIEIWFALHHGTIYLLSGARDRSDWVRNAIAFPHVSVELGDEVRTGTARLVTPDTDEDRLARRLLVEKYRSSEDDLASWGRTSLAVAIDPAT